MGPIVGGRPPDPLGHTTGTRTGRPPVRPEAPPRSRKTARPTRPPPGADHRPSGSTDSAVRLRTSRLSPPPGTRSGREHEPAARYLNKTEERPPDRNPKCCGQVTIDHAGWCTESGSRTADFTPDSTPQPRWPRQFRSGGTGLRANDRTQHGEPAVALRLNGQPIGRPRVDAPWALRGRVSPGACVPVEHRVSVGHRVSVRHRSGRRRQSQLPVWSRTDPCRSWRSARSATARGRPAER